MDHQQFEQWLLTEEPLTTAQSDALQSHLKTCQFCQQLSAAWSEVERVFQTAQLVEPEPGFVSRWQARLETQLTSEILKRQRRQSWMILTLTSIGASLFFVFNVGQLLSTFDSPSKLLVYWVGQISTLLSTFNVIQEVSTILFRTVSTVVPMTSWVLLLSILSILSLLWIISLQQIYLRGGLFNEVDN